MISGGYSVGSKFPSSRQRQPETKSSTSSQTFAGQRVAVPERSFRVARHSARAASEASRPADSAGPVRPDAQVGLADQGCMWPSGQG